MAKSAKRKSANGVRTAADRARTVPTGAANVTESDIARRAYDLYVARGCKHGHHLDDWLQAERELRQTLTSSTV